MLSTTIGSYTVIEGRRRNIYVCEVGVLLAEEVGRMRPLNPSRYAELGIHIEGIRRRCRSAKAGRASRAHADVPITALYNYNYIGTCVYICYIYKQA